MRNKLISSASGLAFGFAASGFAFAADMPVKAPPMAAPAPAYSWTGWYVGVNAGASMGNAKTDFDVIPPAPFPGFAGSATTSPSGVIGGGQLGYNWQFSPLWVAGIEADIQATGEHDHNSASRPFSFTFAPGIVPPAAVTGTAAVDYATKIDWFGTVRGRFGYVWGTNGTVFSYVTGGLAYGEVKINGTAGASGTVGVLPFFVADSFSHSHVNTGWTLGYGTEGAIDFWGAHNWTWKVESLYMDLGHLSAADARGLITSNTHFTDWILRGGLNYRF